MLPFPELQRAAGERETLLATLGANRALVLWKLRDVDERAARQPMVGSGTTLLGVVKHLAWMERDFFAGDVAGIEFTRPWEGDDPDGDWTLNDGDTVASVAEFYADAVGESNAIVADFDFDAVVGPDDDPMAVRHVVAHMIEETARHLGHMDILREIIDGETGYLPDT